MLEEFEKKKEAGLANSIKLTLGDKVREIVSTIVFNNCNPHETDRSLNKDISEALSAIMSAVSEDKKGLEEPIKQTCETCEHDGDKSGQYCDCCGQHNLSNWKKASWIIEAELSKAKEQVKSLYSEVESDRIHLDAVQVELKRLKEGLEEIIKIYDKPFTNMDKVFLMRNCARKSLGVE